MSRPRLVLCLAQAGEEQLQALDAWLHAREEATISVGVVARDFSRRCTLHVHGQTFESSCIGDGYATSWRAIVQAIGDCEDWECRNPDATDRSVKR